MRFAGQRSGAKHVAILWRFQEPLMESRVPSARRSFCVEVRMILYYTSFPSRVMLPRSHHFSTRSDAQRIPAAWRAEAFKVEIRLPFVRVLQRPAPILAPAPTNDVDCFGQPRVARRVGIETKKRTISKKSGTRWGVLVHGNRILASVVFAKYGAARLSQPITQYSAAMSVAAVSELCSDAYEKMVAAVDANYAGKFLAVLFKNPTMSKSIFDSATA